jgi:heme-NO-binding protein
VHGLVNRSIESFIRDTYGADIWAGICQDARLGFDSFEAMLTYDDSLTGAVLATACRRLDRTRTGLLEDMGTFLVSHPELDALRRLLRFGGDTFEEFLHSLDDLHDRARLALPELDFPTLELKEFSPRSYSLACRWVHKGFGAMVLGILRAMADDYGALVLLDHSRGQDDLGDVDRISINLLDASFAEGREFDLGASP